MKQERILVTGAGGQIGTVLTESLKKIFGDDNVLATDIRELPAAMGRTAALDVMDASAMAELCKANDIGQIYHLAAILSATGEKMPQRAWEINMTSLFNVLETARSLGMAKVYFPSSIAVFGQQNPKIDSPQYGPLIPETVYGISKAAGENWCQYYRKRYGLDVRSLRYPGVVGWQSAPGGGTTDYAVDIFHHAVKGQPYECFLEASARLPMIYMDDAIRATIELMQAPAERIAVPTSYNLAGMSFTPAELAVSIQKILPDFEIRYAPDFRQAIAESWPESIDDAAARRDWGWRPKFDIDAMSSDMIEHLR